MGELTGGASEEQKEIRKQGGLLLFIDKTRQIQL